MYVITGITGQIGGAIGRALLKARQPVRAVVRDVVKGQAWADQGCAVALAAIEDASSLAKAFRGAEAVFVLVPSCFDPQPGFPEARAIATALHSALQTARPESGLSFDHRRAGRSGKLTQPAHSDRGSARRSAGGHYLLAAGLVYGEQPLGRRGGTPFRSRSQFLATLGQTRADGGYR